MIAVIGGGAAGFFAAINIKEKNPGRRVVLLEKTRQPLAKVRISGGGRCNVTHQCFEPKRLVECYPRGKRELLGPFTRFGPVDTIEWFLKRGVQLKTEADGRMFPVSDSSETIIECFLNEAKRLGVELRLQTAVLRIDRDLSMHLPDEILKCAAVVLATGSVKGGIEMAEKLGHTKVDPVPSLFTFNCPTSPLLDLAGLSVPKARVSLVGTKLEALGPVLITHWGFSGPAILRLSAFGARILHEKQYQADLLIDWAPDLELPLPKNLARRLTPETLHKSLYKIEGKTTFKQEFVTAGGITLKEVDFRTMESKIVPGLYFAGEILDIDGITGGFNFQNAWTGGWLISEALKFD